MQSSIGLSVIVFSGQLISNNKLSTFAEVYDGEWTDFALIYPGATSSHIADPLVLETPELFDLDGSEQSGILYWIKDAQDNAVELDLFDSTDVVLCDSTILLFNMFTTPAITFTKGAQGEWLAQKLDVGSSK